MKISTIILVIFFISCLNAQTPVWDWVATAGGTSDVQLNAVIGDDNGNIYAVGYFEGSHFFGNEYVASQGEEIFLWLKWILREIGSGVRVVAEPLIRMKEMILI